MASFLFLLYKFDVVRCFSICDVIDMVDGCCLWLFSAKIAREEDEREQRLIEEEERRMRMRREAKKRKL